MLPHDNFTSAYNFERNSDKYQDFTSVPSLDHRGSNEFNPKYVQIHSKKSFTEYSLKDRENQGMIKSK